MANKLVIVESPTKAKTISRVLGRAYQVRASGGHVRDLPKTKMGVDTAGGFEPQYLIPRDKAKTVKELRELVQGASIVYLATDPDREGEAIAWHIAEATGAHGGGRKVQRISFHEITPEAIRAAVSHPRDLDMNLVGAQQARRILDRLVGYKLSPLLWKKVQRGLSAGRVQSVAVRLVVERERDIEAFNAVEYWSIEVDLAKQLAAAARSKKTQVVHAALHSVRGKKPDLSNTEQAHEIIATLEGASYVVESVKTRETRRNPAAPFITSTLQQEASRKLNFTARRTMQVAQQLYEGVELGKEGSVGLISYMRTDSTNVAVSAQEEARAVIAARYGADFVPPSPPQYTKKVRGAQEAHEAIRPTTATRDPDSLTAYLSSEQLRLYRLIWQRFLASQMASAVLDQTTVDIGADGIRDTGYGVGEEEQGAGDGSGASSPGSRLPAPGSRPHPWPYTFRATGSVIKFPGFLSVYREGQDSDEQDELDKKALPQMEQDELLDLIKLWPEQHFTQPPQRFTEASLVKALEEQGIGRPSTYAPIMSTVQERGYVEKIEKKLVPTELGRVVNDLLVEQFPDVVGVNFTSQMENELDDVAVGEREWRRVIGDFYAPFDLEVERAEREVAHISLAKPEPERLGELCPLSGHELLIRQSRYGRFIACSGFPACRYTRPLLEKVGVPCPVCREGDMVEKRSRKGKVFYSCSRYPDCTFSVWNRPLPGACPQCGGLIMAGPRGEGAKCSQCEWASSTVPPDDGRVPINNQPVVPASAVEKPVRRPRTAAADGATSTGKKTTTTRKTATKKTTATKAPATATRTRKAASNGNGNGAGDLDHTEELTLEATGTETAKPRRTARAKK